MTVAWKQFGDIVITIHIVVFPPTKMYTDRSFKRKHASEHVLWRFNRTLIHRIGIKLTQRIIRLILLCSVCMYV